MMGRVGSRLSDHIERRHHVRPADLPKAVLPEFNALRKEVADLTLVWRLYADLFGNKDYQALIDRGDVRPTFLLIHLAMRSSIVMSFGRLLDPPTARIKGSPANLSLEHLVVLLGAAGTHADLCDNLRKMLTEMRQHCMTLDLWRDKHFGHADKNHSRLGRERLPDVDASRIEEVVAMLKGFLSEIHAHFNPGTEFPFPQSGDHAGRFMSLLADGVKFREDEVERIVGLP
jgi:AbiU2